MKKLLIFIILTFLFNNLYSQQFEWAFGAGNHIDDYAIGLKSDLDSNVYLTGQLYGDVTLGDTTINAWQAAYLVKISNAGNVNWAVSFGTFDTYGIDVAIDSDGNVYLAGIYSHGFTIEGITLNGGLQSRIFLMKFNKNGKLLWAKDFGTISNTSRSYVNALELDSNNNIYIGGYFQNSIRLGDSTYTARGREDMLLIKLSSDGEVLSVKNPGSISSEYIYDIAVNSDGVYVVGYFAASTIEFDSLIYNSQKGNVGCIIKYSHSGKLEWVNTINAPIYSETFSVTTNMDGEAIVASMWTEGNGNVQKIALTKFSANGKLLNNQLIDQAVYINSYVEGGVGRKRWGLASKGRCVYFSAGLSGAFKIEHLDFTSIGRMDVAIIKFNEVGYPQWITTAQGTGNDEGLCLTSVGNNIYVAGDYSSSQLSFGNLTINNHSGNDDNDFFLARLADTTTHMLCPDIDSFHVSYPSIICEGDSILISIENSYATYTDWFRNDEKLNYANEKQIFIKDEGNYKVLINENSRCPVPEIQINVNLEENQGQNTDIVIYHKPIANIEGSAKVCLYDTLSLSTPSNDNYIYSWTVPEMLLSSDTTAHNIEIEMTERADAMAFYVEVINKQSGCASADSFTVFINPTPNLYLFRFDSTIRLNSNNTDSVHWYYEGKGLPEFANYQSIIPENKGYYYVRGTNVYGCESLSDSIYIDEINGIENIESVINVFPNPVGDYIIIKLAILPDKIELIDISGTLIRTYYNEAILNLDHVKKGFYILKIYSKNVVSAVKIIKE